ncbi:MAG: DUF6702 family protein, partial [Bacteroidota bacterium]
IDYLTKNLQINSAGTCTELTDFSFSYNEDFIKIRARVTGVSKPVKQIHIRNTCLIDTTEGHSNIIKCRLHGKLRAFRLNADRVTTVIEY